MERSESQERRDHYQELRRRYLNYEWVDTEDTVKSLVTSLENQPNSPPSFYLDVEGVNLGRYGTVSIVQLYHRPRNMTYLIDIHVMQETAFDISNANGTTLRSILESPKIIKVFFDVRNDSDALYSHYNVSLQGIEDVQLYHSATTWGRKRVSGLKTLVKFMPDRLKEEGILSFFERIKTDGHQFLDRNGGWKLFNRRPLDQELLEYSVYDAQVLPPVWDYYSLMVNQIEEEDEHHICWPQKIKDKTEQRIRESQGPDFNPAGPHDEKIAHPFYKKDEFGYCPPLVGKARREEWRIYNTEKARNKLADKLRHIFREEKEREWIEERKRQAQSDSAEKASPKQCEGDDNRGSEDHDADLKQQEEDDGCGQQAENYEYYGEDGENYNYYEEEGENYNYYGQEEEEEWGDDAVRRHPGGEIVTELKWSGWVKREDGRWYRSNWDDDYEKPAPNEARLYEIERWRIGNEEWEAWVVAEGIYDELAKTPPPPTPQSPWPTIPYCPDWDLPPSDVTYDPVTGDIIWDTRGSDPDIEPPNPSTEDAKTEPDPTKLQDDNW